MLDLFFRKYAWTANLALLFAAAWLCARTVNTVVATIIRPRPGVDLTALPSAPRQVAPPRLEPEKLYALVGQKPPAVAASGPEGAAAQPQSPQNCADQGAAPVKTGLRAQLVAAVVSDHPRSSIASITDLNTRETHVYGVGDQLLGSQILSIERLRDDRDAAGRGFRVVAIVCNAGQKEYVDFEPGEGGVTVPPRPLARGGVPEETEPAPGTANAADGVKKLTDNRYEVKKKFIDETLSNLNNVATQARIVPSFKNGVANGFKLFSIQPGSLYSAIGVENGDVIQRINGFEMNSPDKALEVYQKLRDSPHISIDIERNGQVIHKDYNVTQ
jgi:general secretion pathway protein C